MPRVKDGVERVTDEERKEMAKKAKAELTAEAKAAPKELKTEGVAKLDTNVAETKVVGSTMTRKADLDKAFAKNFAYVPVSKVGWIAMSEEEVAQHTAEGTLVGFDPATGLGLLKKG